MADICASLLFVEGLLVGDLVGLGAAISRQQPGTLLAPAAGLALFAAYAAAAAASGAFATSHRDVG